MLLEKVCGKIYIREVYKSELTELKARDASCPKGKKMDMRKCRTIGICQIGKFLFVELIEK